MSTLHPKPFLPSDPPRLRAGSRASNSVERAAVASVIAKGSLGDREPSEVAARLFPGDPQLPRLFRNAPHLRAAVPPLDTANASALVGSEVLNFALSLPGSAASKLFSSGITASLAGTGSVKIPRVATALPVIPPTDEGDPAVVLALQLAAATLGPAAKLMVLTCFSRELAKSSAAEAVISSILREAAARSLDLLLFGSQAGTDTVPPGLLNGVTPIAAAPVGPLAAVDDVQALAGAVMAAGAAELAIVAGSRAAVGLQLRFPDLKIPVWPTLGLPPDTVVALDPSVFVGAFGPDPEITSSIEATLHMEDTTPLHFSTGAQGSAVVASPQQSMFQVAMIALRLVLDMAWCLREPRIAVINGVNWA